MTTELDFVEALRTLIRHEVEFMVVGGVAAILQGSPLTTEDLDILFLASDENIDRLVATLQELEAYYLDPASHRIEPNPPRLASLRMYLLKTNHGRLDVFRTVGDGLGYEALLPRSRHLKIAEMNVRILDLDAIIETKEQAGRPKDHYQLPFLRQLQAEIEGLKKK